MKGQILALVLFFVGSSSPVFSQAYKDTIIIADGLEIIALSENALMHVSYATLAQFGTFGSNGLIYINGNEAVFMDTPMSKKHTKELLDWFTKTYPEVKIKGLIINHFHDDALGGKDLFVERNIPLYAHRLTPVLAKRDSIYFKSRSFETKKAVKVGKEKVICQYFGEGHTSDNIVAYIPSEKILFGGCMLKAMNAGKGNLADANVKEWARTVTKVKNEFKELQIAIPGHGTPGGMELLDFTISLFEEE